jgi:hypothetical protein
MPKARRAALLVRRIPHPNHPSSHNVRKMRMGDLLSADCAAELK